jgi:glycosyltransferase involved in cell wall biosynthesis
MNHTSLRETAKRLLPKGSRRREVARFIYRAGKSLVGKGDHPPHSISYARWIEKKEPLIWVPEGTVFKRKPLISIVVPTYNTPERYIGPLLGSILSQTYDKWELCIADGSTDSSRAAAIKDACGVDERIHYKHVGKKQSIVINTNAGVQMTTGDFVGFVDHDDMLSPHAFYEIVAAFNDKPSTKFFYSDEDKISDDGKRRSHPFFKPDWSPQMLEAVNYMTHFVVVRRSLLEKIGSVRENFEGAQDYDFILRATDATKHIVHIPKMLYHWRLAEGSTSGPIDNKEYANDAGLRALKDHVKRCNIQAKVLGVPELPTNYRLQYKTNPSTLVSIIIPFKDEANLLKNCITSILEKTTHKTYEIILVSNNSTEKKTHAYLKTLEGNERIKIFYHDVPFNFSEINNFGRSKASGEYLVLLNNDTEVIVGDWLRELLGVASQPWAGAVGPLLLYPNGTIQHAGVVMGMDTMAGHVFRHMHEDALTPFGRPYWPRNYLAVTAACVVIKTSKYDQVGGLDETFVVTGQDVAFCLRLHEKGYRNVYWPFAKLYHYESVSVGSYSKAPATDYSHSLTYYRPYLLWHDPYYNLNLSLRMEQIAFREDYSGELN